MVRAKAIPLLALLGAIGVAMAGLLRQPNPPRRPRQMLAYEVDVRTQQLALFWKDDKGRIFGNIQRLKDWTAAHGQRLVFAANAGMFNPQHAPQGLLIQAFQTRAPLDTQTTGRGNFYLQPNGVFYTTADGRVEVCPTKQFVAKNVRFATQSGPMLVVDGLIPGMFSRRSTNLNIRNGVGILPNGRALFAMSKERVSFYEFASYFAERGCRNALYLDGAISRTYYPAAGWEQLDGELGVLVGVTEPLTKGASNK